MITKQKTFCVAPWFQIRNSNNMSKSVCCVISDKITENIQSQSMSALEYLNTKPIIDLKKDLANGVKSKHCSKCWDDEKRGIRSYRQGLNSLLSMQKDPSIPNWMDTYFSRKNDFMSDLVLSADIKVGNTCNYACVMCSPKESSMIYANWMDTIDHPIIRSKLAEDPQYLERAKSFSFKNKIFVNYLDDVLENNKHIKFLNFIGGEPFLDQFLLEKLRSLPVATKNKLSLMFVTNASKNFSEIINSLGDFKYVQCSVSLEGIGEVQEWARYGSDWNQVEKNVLKGVKNPKIDMTVLHTFQTATVLGFKDLASWCKSNSIKLATNIVYEPACLSVKTLPKNIKEKLLVDIVNNKDIINNIETRYEDLLVKVQNLKYDASLRDDFFEYIEWYEAKKNIRKLKNIFPQLYKLDNE